MLEQDEADSDEPAPPAQTTPSHFGGGPKQQKARPQPKPKTMTQKCSAALKLASTKITESKGWWKKLQEANVSLGLHYWLPKFVFFLHQTLEYTHW